MCIFKCVAITGHGWISAESSENWNCSISSRFGSLNVFSLVLSYTLRFVLKDMDLLHDLLKYVLCIMFNSNMLYLCVSQWDLLQTRLLVIQFLVWNFSSVHIKPWKLCINWNIVRKDIQWNKVGSNFMKTFGKSNNVAFYYIP